MFRLLATPYIKKFEGKSPEKILKLSLNLLDPGFTANLRDYVRTSQTQSGGFKDRAGNPDLYYTLFGWFVADALGMKQECSLVWPYVRTEIRLKEPEGVYLHCAAVLSAVNGQAKFFRKSFGAKLRQSAGMKDQKLYGSFLSLLSFYYLMDFRGLFRIRQNLRSVTGIDTLPCPVTSASLVLSKSFREPVDGLINVLMTFYDGKGGFRATHSTTMADLLSTAVALYALRFAGYDLREIKPDSLDFADSLFRDGGFSGHPLDPDPDIEYTFYGLLALGSLND
ncbi:MAG: prenyltransferase/squalene oxidase repeat-containing protein [Bacteroidales bacterium]